MFSFKQYYKYKEDKYPTFSICLSIEEYESSTLYQEANVKEVFGIDEATYYFMMGGYPSGNINFSTFEFDEGKWDILRGILTLYGSYDRKMDTFSYWLTSKVKWKIIPLSPFIPVINNLHVWK